MKKKIMRILLCIYYIVDGASVTIDEDIIDFANDQGNRWLECECDLTLCPAGRVKWYHDGKVLSSAFGDGYMIISDRLQLTGTSRKLMGAYQCESDGIKSEPSIVKNSSNEKIEIKERPRTQQVASGEPAKLTCESNVVPRSAINWFKNGMDLIADDSNYEIRARFDEGSSSLHFNSVDIDDAGEYTCCNADQFNDCQLTSKAVTLEVTRARWIVRPESMVTGKPGQDVSIHCQPNDVDSDVQWLHNGHRSFELGLNSRFDDRIYVDSNGTLFINDVKESDAGKYECIYGKFRAESTLTVLYNHNQVQQIVVYETDSVSAPCPSASDDDRVTWFHKARPIDDIDRAKLLIGSANVTHAGEWQCKHKNGSFYFNIKVNQGIVPKQPNVTQQSGNILIAWDNAVPDAQQYTIIQFKSADDIIWKQLTQVRDLDQFEVNSNRILEELPNAKQVVFRIAFTDAKKLHTRFSDESSLVEVYNMNQLLVIVGGLSVAILLFFILTVLLVMRKCTDNHLKGSSRTKDFTYNKPYQTYDHTNQQPLFLIRNGSDSGHGTHSSTSRHEIENIVWNESPRLYHPKETINSHKSSHHSAYNFNHSSTANFQRNGIGEYAQIDIMPVERRNYDLRQEPIYESIDHQKP